MEFFSKAKAVRLKSHHDKYLIADENEETVRQSRKGSSRRTWWTVEFVPGNSYQIRLKSFYGKYLTALDEPFLLDMSRKKVVQDMPTSKQDSRIVWEPQTAEFRVKLRTRGGNFLQANGGLPPWRNSITHDIPVRTATQDGILWEVDIVDIIETDSLPSDSISPVLSLSSFSPYAAGSECLDTSHRLAPSTTASSHGHACAGEVAIENEAIIDSDMDEPNEKIVYGWQPPEQGWIKVNTTSLVTKSASAAAGGVVRGSKGQWLRGFMHRLSHCTAAMAEIWAVYSGLSIAWELKMPKVIVEIDNLEVVEVLLRRVNCRAEEIPLLECIRDLVGREWTLRFVHTHKKCNLVAGWLARQALMKDDGQMILESPPDGCLRLLFDDAVGACTFP